MERKIEMKSKNILINIKSDYFILKIFDNIKKIKTLDIIKYNRKLQEILNYNINNYKEYSEIYSSIKIEITTVKNKYGKFINIINKEDAQYYHIYFNNTKEEIKRNYLNENENINIINVKINYQIKSFDKLFKDCKCIE